MVQLMYIATDIVNAATSDVVMLLVLITIIDIMTGWIKAFVLKTIESDLGIRGLVKHIGAILIVILSHPLFTLSPYGHTLWTMIVLLLIFSQAVSILENWSAMGLPLPKAVSSRIRKAKEMLEESEEIVTIEDITGGTQKETQEAQKVDTDLNTVLIDHPEDQPSTRMEKHHPQTEELKVKITKTKVDK